MPSPWNPPLFPERLAGLAVTRPWEADRPRDPEACPTCWERDWWRLKGGTHRVCRRCHPPFEPDATEPA